MCAITCLPNPAETTRPSGVVGVLVWGEATAGVFAAGMLKILRQDASQRPMTDISPHHSQAFSTVHLCGLDSGGDGQALEKGAVAVHSGCGAAEGAKALVQTSH